MVLLLVLTSCTVVSLGHSPLVAQNLENARLSAFSSFEADAGTPQDAQDGATPKGPNVANRL